MPDSIRITGLRVRGFHGVLDYERTDGQDFFVDAVLWLDTAPAAAADDLTLTADYGALTGALAAVVAGEPVDLIETLAARLAAQCLADPAVQAAEITVHKPQAPVGQPVADISVTIRRDRAGAGVSGHDGAATREIVLSLGSNLGDRLANLQLGIDRLAGNGLDGAEVSGVYQTAPVGGPDQEDYLNAVLVARSALAADDILRRCAAAEAAAGRVRTVRWGPRTLDVDVIACGAERSSDPALTLPHPRARERAFVLAPWLELRPGAILPGAGPVADLLAAAGTAGIRRRPELRLTLPGRDGAAPCE